MQQSSDCCEMTLGNTVPVQPQCVSSCLHSTYDGNSSMPCHFAEPFGAADDGSASALLVGLPDTNRVHGRTTDRAHHVAAGVHLYSEMQRGGQVVVSTDPPSSMKTCPSAASVLSYARSDTDSSANGPTCRICDSAGDGSNRLISPCRCSGTSKFVHEQCLNVSGRSFVSANNIIMFKKRLDKHWQHQEIIYDFRAQIHGAGSRSEVSRVNVV